MDVQDLWLFIVAGLLLNITPGPDMGLIIARSAQHGVHAGAMAALGVTAGCFVHIVAAAFGVSAILMASALAFSLLKWAGAVYLVYLGLRMLWSSFNPRHSEAVGTIDGGGELPGIFFQGFLTNTLNPKVALFFLAFVPQFISADASSKVSTFILLGLLFNANSTVWNLLVAWTAGRLAASPHFQRVRVWLDRTIGALLIALGARLALAERS
jgi:threonine/homoserine/homoserine lactone efflux protein